MGFPFQELHKPVTARVNGSRAWKFGLWQPSPSWRLYEPEAKSIFSYDVRSRCLSRKAIQSSGAVAESYGPLLMQLLKRDPHGPSAIFQTAKVLQNDKAWPWSEGPCKAIHHNLKDERPTSNEKPGKRRLRCRIFNNYFLFSRFYACNENLN